MTDDNMPCKTCGRTDLPLHVNRQCPECFVPDRVVCHSQGKAGTEQLVIGVGRHVCGDIMDGVGIHDPDDRGPFVVAWADFERAYLLNKKKREGLGPPYKSIAEMLAASMRRP